MRSLGSGIVLLLFCCQSAFAAEGPAFLSAKPVWLEGREKESNLFVGFRAEVDGSGARDALLRMTGSSICRVFVNGKFFAYGPARGPAGYFRVDEWPLGGRLRPGRNHVAIEVAGYNVNSYYLMNQPAFLQAEIVAGGRVLASTGGGGARFQAAALPFRIQKVPRYSFQRPWSEAYSLRPSYAKWRQGAGAFTPGKLAVLEPRRLLPRIAPYPSFDVIRPVRRAYAGKIKDNPAARARRSGQSSRQEGDSGKNPAEISCADVRRMKNISSAPVDPAHAGDAVLAIDDLGFEVVDFGFDAAGFLGATLSCSAPTRVYLVFDEILQPDNDVSSTRMGTCNVLPFDLNEPGEYRVESFEPYGLRYVKVIACGAPCNVSDLHLRQYVNPEADRAVFKTPDKDLNKIFEAARNSFKENAVDCFTDCPTRERAGWLCDSFFTARASADLTGNLKLEELFLQNFLMPDSFPRLPKGMIPGCYPADQYGGCFIPNWAMWFVLELDEFQKRGGDPAMVKALRPRVLGLVDFFHKHRNKDGLLEKLPGWIFVEWSEANRFVQDVNYPSNMTYAEMLSCVARLYNRPDLEAEAEQVRGTIRKQSFNGKFFVDNAIRQKDGTLKLSGKCTEVCQYYAFFFKTATPESHPELWETLRADFGPKRHQTNKYPDVFFANAFIGNFLRFELLSRQGLAAQILDESKDYFLYMAERTGTLWEHTLPKASCCHGFTSHVAHLFYRDILGVKRLDVPNKKITLAFSDIPLPSCEGAIPIGKDLLKVRWTKAGRTLLYSVRAPEGFAVEVLPSNTLEIKKGETQR